MTRPRDNKVPIEQQGGRKSVVKPAAKNDSPLNVEGVDISISASEIVDILREIRER